jgi:RNA polymerase sigma-70 factor (ECF subfamily)
MRDSLPRCDSQPTDALPSVGEIFQQELPYVARVLRYFGVPDADLADVCQEVFVVVHRKLPQFERRSAIRTWLFRISQRTAADYRKRAHVRREIAVPEPQHGLSEDGEESAERVDLRRRLLALLDTLDEDKRAVLVLFEIEGLDMKAVASIMDCPLQTAYSRLHAARRLLKEAFEAESAPMQEGVA